MSKPHLIIICGRVHTFPNRQEGRAMRLRILHKIVASTRNHKFGGWFRNKRKLEAMRSSVLGTPADLILDIREVGDKTHGTKSFLNRELYRE